MNQVHKLRRGDSVFDWLERGDFRAFQNELVEVVYWWRQFKTSQDSRRADLFPHPAVVDIANTTGQALPKFGVVQLGAAAISPTANILEYQQSCAFNGVVPTAPPDLARWAILLEPLPASPIGVSGYPIGRGAIAGSVQCLVNVTSLVHGFAVPIAGNTSYLQSSAMAGGAVILSQPTATGLQWCQVGLGRCCAANFGSLTSGSGPGCTCAATTQLCLTWTSSSIAGFPAKLTLTLGSNCLWQGSFTANGALWGFAFGLGATFNGQGNFGLNATHWYVFLGSGVWDVAPWIIDLGATWDCATTLSGSITSNSATITAGGCGGGGGSSPMTVIEHGTYKGNNVTSLSSSNITIAAGSSVVVYVAWRATNNGGAAYLPTVTYNGVSLGYESNAGANRVNSNADYLGCCLYGGHFASAATGQVVVTFLTGAGTSATAEDLVIAIEEVTSSTSSQWDSGNENCTDPAAGCTGSVGTVADPGSFTTSFSAFEYLAALAVTYGPNSDSTGTWDNGFTMGQTVSTSNIFMRTGGQLVSVTGTYDPQLTGITARPWSASTGGVF